MKSVFTYIFIYTDGRIIKLFSQLFWHTCMPFLDIQRLLRLLMDKYMYVIHLPLPYVISLLSNGMTVSLPYEISLLSNTPEGKGLALILCFTTLRNFTTLKPYLDSSCFCFCFTTLRNFTTLKLVAEGEKASQGFTTIRNYTTLKLFLNPRLEK